MVFFDEPDAYMMMRKPSTPVPVEPINLTREKEGKSSCMFASKRGLKFEPCDVMLEYEPDCKPKLPSQQDQHKIQEQCSQRQNFPSQTDCWVPQQHRDMMNRVNRVPSLNVRRSPRRNMYQQDSSWSPQRRRDMMNRASSSSTRQRVPRRIAAVPYHRIYTIPAPIPQLCFRDILYGGMVTSLAI